MFDIKGDLEYASITFHGCVIALEKYKEKNFQFALRTKKNLHNNYLDILVGMGIIGLFLFLMGWLILPMKVAFSDGDFLSVLIILTFGIAMITEVYFDRSLGGMLVGFFIPFLLTGKRDNYALSVK